MRIVIRPSCFSDSDQIAIASEIQKAIGFCGYIVSNRCFMSAFSRAKERRPAICLGDTNEAASRV
jgi:hypothetical protein